MSMEIRTRALETALRLGINEWDVPQTLAAAKEFEGYLAGPPERANADCVACDAWMRRVTELESDLRVAAAGVPDDRRVVDTLNEVLAVARTLGAPYRADVEGAVERAASRLGVSL